MHARLIGDSNSHSELGLCYCDDSAFHPMTSRIGSGTTATLKLDKQLDGYLLIFAEVYLCAVFSPISFKGWTQ